VTLLVVTGTGTEVGKTIVTAAIAAIAAARGLRVAVVKPAQTGLGAGDESDVEAVARLSGLADIHELIRYPEPLAPATAARRAGVAALRMTEAAHTIRALADRDLTIVEGAGGLLVRLDAEGATIADLAADLGADVLVVANAGLGTLNATALTCQAIRDRGLRCRGVVVGSWPSRPDLAATENLTDLPSYAGAPLLGCVPAGAGSLSQHDFRAAAPDWLTSDLGGRWVPG
jgi:dethiobiotin synthetase